MKLFILFVIFCTSSSSFAGGYGLICFGKDQSDNERVIELYHDGYVGFVDRESGDTVPVYDDHLACGLKKTSSTNCKIEFVQNINGDATFSSRCTLRGKPIKEMNGNFEWSEKDHSGFFICGVLPSRNLILKKCVIQ